MVGKRKAVGDLRCAGMGADGQGRRRLAVGLFVAYLAVAGYGVFGPEPGDQIDRAGDGARKVAGEIGGAVPGQRTGEEASSEPTDDDLLGGLEEEAVANVALFVPFGLLFPLVLPRWRWWTVAAAVAASATIEAVQLLVLSWRSPSWGDIGWNSLGGVIGFGLWWAAASVLPRTMTSSDP